MTLIYADNRGLIIPIFTDVHMPLVTCHLSLVTCHLSLVTYHLSLLTFNF